MTQQGTHLELERASRARSDALDHEILERKRAESALRSERDRAQRYLDTADVILLALDLDGRITQVNRYACSILGWTSEELLGRDWVETCLPARIRDTLRVKFHSLVDGDLSSVENPVLTRSNEERLIEWRNTLLRDDEGRVVGTFSSGSDITERERAEKEIRLAAQRSTRAEREFRAVFAANPLPMWIYDVATLQFLEVNDAALLRYGYERDEFLGMTIKDIRPPEDVERLLTVVSRPREAWQESGSWRHRLKSGQLIDVEVASHTITFTGRCAALVVAQDVTDRKRAEEAHRESEARYRTLFEYAPDGIVIADRESYYIDANASICKMLGYSRDELIGRHASDIVTEAEVQHIEPALRAITAASDYHREWQFRRRDGSAFAADVLATVMPDGNLLAMIRDVTERNQAIEAVRTAEERIRFALESAGVGIWDMDFTTGVLLWSGILEAQYGLQPGTFEGTFEAFVRSIHPDDRKSVQETVGKAMGSGSDFSVMHRARWPDGTVRWLSGAGRIQLGADGTPKRGVGISLDVTERRTLEEQFHQAQKMEAIGQLAGGVAHDFNNLLTVILGYCELLLADLAPGDSRRADIAEIQQAGNRAAGLTRQLLAFSRKEIIELTRLDLNAVVADLRAMLGRLIGEDVKIVLALQPDLAAVRADRGQMEQIVMNLAVNARDAMPTGGTLTIGTADVGLDEHDLSLHPAVPPGRYVELTVTDTGTGMTPDVQTRLFEPFFTTKERGKGTGLGLAAVHGIVTRVGGSVKASSEIGKGASFSVYFPRADAADAVAGVPLPATPPRAGTQTVLVVEDAEEPRRLTRRLLEKQGYTVLLAADAHEALALFERNASIDVLLTDVVMPGASGAELAGWLAARRPALKVVYMSGYTNDAVLQHAVVTPGVAFLHKPFTGDTLGRKIREVLDR